MNDTWYNKPLPVDTSKTYGKTPCHRTIYIEIASVHAYHYAFTASSRLRNFLIFIALSSLILVFYDKLLYFNEYNRKNNELVLFKAITSANN